MPVDFAADGLSHIEAGTAKSPATGQEEPFQLQRLSDRVAPEADARRARGIGFMMRATIEISLSPTKPPA
jgi:hypothetical protein